MKRIVIALAVGCGLGVVADQIFFHKPSAALDHKSFDVLRSKMSLLQTDFDDYSRLKNLEEKYKKADEILKKSYSFF